MTPWLQDADVTLYHGDALTVLRELPAESVDCCVTSPPYWGLRDYGQEGQIGLEPTPEEYVTRMVEVFREVRRVLAAHGTVWLNLGDSYNAYNGNRGLSGSTLEGTDRPDARPRLPSGHGLSAGGLKNKDLVGIPWRVAFALQADGWYLRSDIIWAKPNPMPESVTDRPTKAHEYVFLLSKQPRYFFDQEAVREPHESTRWGGRYHTQNPNGKYTPDSDVRIAAASKSRADRPDFDHYPHGGRNIRSVWEIATQPFSGRELFGGDGRIPSPDCPVHGDRPAPAPTELRGERADTPSLHTQRSDDRPVQEPLDGPVPTAPILVPDSAQSSSDSLPPASTATAIPNSTRTRKTSSRSDERDTASEETHDRIPDSAPSHESPALDGFDSHGSSETDDRKARTSGLTGGAYSPPGQAPHGNARGEKPSCTCKYIDHFATFPEELARRCIAAGCPESVCRVCGRARERIVDVESSWRSRSENGAIRGNLAPEGLVGAGTQRAVHGAGVSHDLDSRRREVIGYTDCGHDDYQPGHVLDPFIGSGTVAHVARKLGRHAVGIDLSESYLKLAARRLQQQSLFASEVAS